MTSAQQKAVRKKKRTCKHVLKAQEEREQQQQQLSSQDAQSNEKKPNKKKRKKNHVKDPKEAAAYLSCWKHKDVAGGWKFNKNTQSWLLRHQYDSDKVPKASFGILLDYLKGLQGNIRTRTIEDAKRRALRYKEYEKSDKKDDTVDDDNGEADPEGKRDDDEDDETRWKRLDDHDKRKEYKRARKVLDALKE